MHYYENVKRILVLSKEILPELTWQSYVMHFTGQVPVPNPFCCFLKSWLPILHSLLTCIKDHETR